MDNITITVDTREQNPWSFSKSKIVGDVVSKKLDTGDYSVLGMESVFCIERKASTSEIANNFTESRWKDVLTRLSKFQYKYIICEFSYDDVMNFPYNSGIPVRMYDKIKIQPAFLISCLAKIQVFYNIPVIYAGNSICAESIAESLIKKVVENGR
jgi:ERCC4-type nuclease